MALLPDLLATLALPAVETLPVVVRCGASVVVAAEPTEIVEADGAAALERLDRLGPGWWAGFLAYDLGHAVERVRPRPGRAARPVPDLVLARYDARLVLGPDGTGRFEGPPAAVGRLRARLESARGPDPADAGGSLAQPTSSLDRPAFEAATRAVIERIEAGDCYQVNLTRRLTWEGSVDPLRLFRATARRSPAPHAALAVTPTPGGHRSVVSASPELFLAWDGDTVRTRPIKGTARDRRLLEASAKDRAENVMIVDLARNDLGRVAVPGTVVVDELCATEAHPGLHHLVSTVRARLRPGVGPGELVRATFPPASVTGAPKPAVLQIVEDLEPVPRGVYCGAVGWIDTEHAAGELSVAIRTFSVLGDRTHLGVGGGIVADSDPASEWAETELKAARLLRALADSVGAGGHDRLDQRVAAST